MAVQQDFGGFDPSFVGITIRYANPELWERANSFWRESTPISLGALPAEARFEALTAVSTPTHEARHFHDFFLSPYSARVFRLRVQFLWNLLELVPHLLDPACNCLFVPVSKWCRLDEAQRRVHLDSLMPRPDGAPWKPVAIPHIPADSDLKGIRSGPAGSDRDPLEALLRACLLLRGRMENLTNPPQSNLGKLSFNPWQVFELSGVLVQLQELWTTFGAEETSFFINHLVSLKDSPYAGMIRVVSEMWNSAGKAFDVRLTSAMVYWSLLGSYEKDFEAASPSMRFLRLWALVQKEGFPARTDDAMALFDAWSVRLGLSRVTDGLQESRALYAKLHEDIERQHAAYPDSFASQAFDGALLRVLAGVEHASDRVVRQFELAPWTYIAPHDYVQGVGDLPNPVFRIRFDNSSARFAESEEDLEKRGYRFQWAADSADGVRVLSLIVPLEMSSHTCVTADDAMQMDGLFSVADFVFDESIVRAKADIQRPGRTYFADSHVKPIEILG